MSYSSSISSLSSARAAYRKIKEEPDLYRSKMKKMLDINYLNLDFKKMKAYRNELNKLSIDAGSGADKMDSVIGKLKNKADKSDRTEAKELKTCFMNLSTECKSLAKKIETTENDFKHFDSNFSKTFDSLNNTTKPMKLFIKKSTLKNLSFTKIEDDFSKEKPIKSILEVNASDILAHLQKLGFNIPQGWIDDPKSMLTQISENHLEKMIADYKQQLNEEGVTLPNESYESLKEEYRALKLVYNEHHFNKTYDSLAATGTDGKLIYNWENIEKLLWKEDLSDYEIAALATIYSQIDDSEGKLREENLEILYMYGHKNTIITDTDTYGNVIPESECASFVRTSNLDLVNEYCQSKLMPKMAAALSTIDLMSEEENDYYEKLGEDLKNPIDNMAMLNDICNNLPSTVTIGSWIEDDVDYRQEGKTYYEINKEYINTYGDKFNINDSPIIDISASSVDQRDAYKITGVYTLNYHFDGVMEGPYSQPIDFITKSRIEIIGLTHINNAEPLLKGKDRYNNMVLESLKPNSSGLAATGKFAGNQSIDIGFGKFLEKGLEFGGKAVSIGSIGFAAFKEGVEYFEDLETVSMIDGTIDVNNYSTRVYMVGGNCQISIVDGSPKIGYSAYPKSNLRIISNVYNEKYGIDFSASDIEDIVFKDSLVEGFFDPENDRYDEKKVELYNWLLTHMGQQDFRAAIKKEALPDIEKLHSENATK